MKGSNIALALLCSGIALAQTEPLMRASATQFGAELSFETRLEPPNPAFSGRFVGGTITDEVGVHRYMAYGALHKFFGYDLQVERKPLSKSYEVTFRPLTITPARVELDNPSTWNMVPLAGYPPAKSVHAGATIALDLFTNPSTGQKIVEYIHIEEPGHKPNPNLIGVGDTLHVNILHQPNASGNMRVKSNGFITVGPVGEVKATGWTPDQLAGIIASRLGNKFQHPVVTVQLLRVEPHPSLTAAEPRDFSVEDVWLKVESPHIRVDGKDIPCDEGSVTGPVIWFYLPDRGRYVLSLVPHRNLGFTKAGGVWGNRLSFSLDGEKVEIRSSDVIAGRTAPYNLYVFRDAGWRPGDGEHFAMGSAESADAIVPLIDDKLRPRGARWQPLK